MSHPSDIGGVLRPTRRGFLKSSATASMAALASTVVGGRVFAGGRETIRVGLIGCGGRGTGAAKNCVESSEDVQIVAIGDLFQDRLDRCRRDLGKMESGFSVDDDHCFVGFDAFEKVIATECDLVILATPPGFRPQHLEAAIAAGKHVFAEKPIATDGPGIRRVMDAAQAAKKKGLAIVAGTQRRHQEAYLECMKRIHDGAIGEVVGGQCYWNQGGLWVHERKEGYSDTEWQLRNWLYFTWASGDHIVEQHVHNIDVMNWAMGAHPVKAMGMGGRQARTDPKYGHIYDHFAIEYEYENGVRILSMCRQTESAAWRVAENIVGSKGRSNPSRWVKGAEEYTYDKRRPISPYVQEHADLIASIRAGEPLNEGLRIAETTLTAIMGRMSCYTGQEVKWSEAMASNERLITDDIGFGEREVPPVAMPGRTKLQ